MSQRKVSKRLPAQQQAEAKVLPLPTIKTNKVDKVDKIDPVKNGGETGPRPYSRIKAMYSLYEKG